MVSSTDYNVILGKRRHADRYVKGNKDVADLFISKLWRTNQPQSRFVEIYQTYINWAYKEYHDVPLGRTTFLEILKTKGFTLQKNSTGHILYVNAEYHEEHDKAEDEHIEDDVDVSLPEFKQESEMISEISEVDPVTSTQSQIHQLTIIDNFKVLAKLELTKTLRELDKLKEAIQVENKNMSPAELLETIKQILYKNIEAK